MRGKWLLIVAGTLGGIGGATLGYLYPTETAQIFETLLGVTAYTAAKIILILTVLSVGVPIGIFIFINVRDYYRRNPQRTRRDLRAGAWTLMIVVALVLGSAYTLLLVVMILYSVHATYLGVVFAGVISFSIASCFTFAFASVKTGVKTVPRLSLMFLFAGAPYFFIFVFAAYIYFGGSL